MTHIEWDPEIDTPATIGVLGGGPIGIEAALYARFLGYFVVLYDRSRVGKSLMGWGDRLMNAPLGEVVTSLGLAALEAQGNPCSLTDFAAPASYRQYVEEYLLPVAKTDLLFESVQFNAPVISLSRTSCTPTHPSSLTRRAEQEFRILADSQVRGEFTQLVDLVLDCSGHGAARRGLASGGGLAVREAEYRSAMKFGKCDVLGGERKQFAGRHAILFGQNLEACANACELQQLAAEEPGTRVTWVVPKAIGRRCIVFDAPPVSGFEELLQTAQAIGDGTNGNTAAVALGAWGIEALTVNESGKWLVKLQTTEEETLEVQGDVFINCAAPVTGSSHLASLPAALQPMQQTASDPFPELDGCLTQEPHYYTLGARSSDAQQGASIADGVQQIRRVFGAIGGRRELDLYSTVRPQA